MPRKKINQIGRSLIGIPIIVKAESSAQTVDFMGSTAKTVFVPYAVGSEKLRS